MEREKERERIVVCAEGGGGGEGEQSEHEEDGVRANSLSFYPILKSECLAPLTLETGCGGREPQRTTAPQRFPGCRHHHRPLSYLLSPSPSLFLPLSQTPAWLPDCLPRSLQPYSIPLLDMPLPTFQPSPSTYVGCRVRGGSRHEILDKTAVFSDFLLWPYCACLVSIKPASSLVSTKSHPRRDDDG